MQNVGIVGLRQPQLDPVISEPVPGRGPLDGIRRDRGRRREPRPGGRLVPLGEPADGGDPPAAHREHLPPAGLAARQGANRGAGHLQADQDLVPRYQHLGDAAAGAGVAAAAVPGQYLCPALEWR